MSGVHDDLATLRRGMVRSVDDPDWKGPTEEALDRVEAEVARLTRERNARLTLDEVQELITGLGSLARLRDGLRDLRREEWTRVRSSLIAVKGHLDTPYPDDPRWTPWTRFVEPALQRMDDAIRALLAEEDA